MNRKEADELIKLVESFVETQADEPKGVVEEPAKKKFDLTEEQMIRLFRRKEVIPENFDPEKVRFVRSPASADKAYMAYEDRKWWVPDPDTLEILGYSMADIKDIPDEELSKMKNEFGLLSSKLWNL